MHFWFKQFVYIFTFIYLLYQGKVSLTFSIHVNGIKEGILYEDQTIDMDEFCLVQKKLYQKFLVEQNCIKKDVEWYFLSHLEIVKDVER